MPLAIESLGESHYSPPVPARTHLPSLLLPSPPVHRSGSIMTNPTIIEQRLIQTKHLRAAFNRALCLLLEDLQLHFVQRCFVSAQTHATV